MAYTPSSGTSQLIAGPTLRTLSSAEDIQGGFIAPENEPKPEKTVPFPVKLKNSGPLLDNSGRIATDLRISLTDKCNLRCIYCMPAEGLQWLPKDNLLSAEEIIRLADVAISQANDFFAWQM